MQIDKDVTSSRAGFTFDNSIASIFNEHVRASIPAYEGIQNLVIDMSDWFITDKSIVVDIGCATGELLDRLDGIGFIRRNADV